MIAFAPANDPKVAVAVVVPAQPGSDTGASTSGPPMKTILGDALAADPVTTPTGGSGAVQDQQFRTPEPSDSRHRL